MLVVVTIYIIFFAMFGFVGSILILFIVRLQSLNWNAMVVLVCSYLISMALFITFGIMFVYKKGGYFARALSANEIEQFQNHYLIHFTDYLGEQEVTEIQQKGIIHLYANGSLEANYSLRGKDRLEKYVWFHLSDRPFSMEPNFKSFWFSHMGESTSRAYKIIIPFSSLAQSKLMIRPYDGAILHRGDFNGPAKLDAVFEWYNSKIYVTHAIRVKFSSIFAILMNGYRQRVGRRLDKK